MTATAVPSAGPGEVPPMAPPMVDRADAAPSDRASSPSPASTVAVR